LFEHDLFGKPVPTFPDHALSASPAILQIARDASISTTSSLEPGGICMISMYSQIAPSRPMLMPDACLAL
jgi:hypothetical protein